jgi:hypothetical protein
MMIYADRKKIVSTTLWNNEQVSYFRPTYIRSSGGQEQPLKNPSYVFSLQHPSLVKGNVLGTTGPFNFYIYEYFDANITPTNLSKSKIFYEAKSLPRDDFKGDFKFELPSGNYCVFFDCGKIAVSTKEIRATFSLIEEHYTKPHVRWFSVGQTMWEVGIPILITGLVSLLLIP